MAVLRRTILLGMSERGRDLFGGLLGGLAAALLPVAGAWAAGRSVADITRFPPPVEIPTGYVHFWWPAAVAVIAAVLAVVGPWWPAVRRTRAGFAAAPRRTSVPRRFPRWGVVALGWTAVWWWLAWTRQPWFSAAQRYTFFPLWLGFIGVVNALTEHRSGSCLPRRAPRRWLSLFVVSDAAWWGFEWLNRFVHNWHYLHVEDFGPLGYAAHASLCFATVLPAVAAVAEWLDAHPEWRRTLSAGPRWRGFGGRRAAWLLALGGAAALLATGAWPQVAYPALWVAPLALLLAWPGLFGKRDVAAEMAEGNWTRAGTWAVAALICGVFWELWNWRSEVKWIYTIPGVEGAYLFEMPLLGYAGYLAFGVECLLVSERVVRGRWRAAAGP